MTGFDVGSEVYVGVVQGDPPQGTLQGPGAAFAMAMRSTPGIKSELPTLPGGWMRAIEHVALGGAPFTAALAATQARSPTAAALPAAATAKPASSPTFPNYGARPAAPVAPPKVNSIAEIRPGAKYVVDGLQAALDQFRSGGMDASAFKAKINVLAQMGGY